MSSSLAFESDIPMKVDSLSVPRHREEESLSIYLSIHIRINKCGSRDRSIGPHQQLDEEKEMMSRLGLGTYQPTIPFWNGKKKGWS
ncbi:hypothetical protein KY284_010572 [Solanum tuberosum]|nr:hypothetical protein KY284_010572 [Solanum tuberosum]